MAFLEKLPEVVTRIRQATTARIRALVQEDPTLVATGATYRPAELGEQEVLNSQQFNFEMQTLLLTLRSIFAQVTETDATRVRHENIINESFKKSSSSLLKSLNDLRVFTFLQQFPEYDDAKFVDFNTARNLSERAPLAGVDTESRVLRLAVSSRTEARVRRANIEPKITITHLGGGRSESLIQDFNPSRMLDGDEKTYWADLMVTEGPIVQEYTDSRGKTRRVNGLVSEVEVRLAEVTRVNMLRLLPFGEYPIGVIDIAYKESESQQHWTSLPDFVEGEPNLDWVEINFPPLQAASIKVVLLQKNYVQGIYHIPEKMAHNTNLMDHVIAEAYKDRVGTGAISDPEVAQVAVTPELLGLLEAINEFDVEVLRTDLPEERVREHELSEGLLRAMARVLSRPDISVARDMLEPAGIEVEAEEEKLLELKTTEYLVGLREFQISYVIYQPVSYYASPKFTASKTPLELSMAVSEEHPHFADSYGGFRLTNVEYNVDFGEGLRMPIFPENFNTAQDEFVPVDRHTKIGYTRFTPSSLAVYVRKNGVKLPTADFSFAIDSSTLKGKLTIVANYSPTAIYTVTYVPTDRSKFIELPTEVDSSLVRVPESFQGTDENNRVITKYLPFIAWEVVNDEDNWNKRTGEGVWEYTGPNVTIDGIEYSSDGLNIYEPVTVLVNNIKATNITDYESNEQPLFTEVDPQEKLFQFFHIGNSFYFNASIQNQQITINYRWLVQYIQLVATLQSFKQAGVDITPKVKDYRLQLRTSPI